MKKKNEKKQKKIVPVKSSLIKDVNEDTNQIKKFAIILLGVALIAVLLYFLTAKYLVKDEFQGDDKASSEVNISYDLVNGGNVFNRPYDEYYVFAYNPTEARAVYYASLISNYKEIGKKKIYFMDLSLDINKQYVKEKSNKEASKPSELELIDPTLILIKDGKISKYYDEEETIIEKLK